MSSKLWHEDSIDQVVTSAHEKINELTAQIAIADKEMALVKEKVTEAAEMRQQDVNRYMAAKIQNSKFVMWGIGIFVSMVLTVSGAIISMYSTIQSQQIQITRLDWDVTKNTEFSTKWPTGSLGSLPDDSVQNTKLESLDYDIKDIQSQINKLFNEKQDIKK